MLVALSGQAVEAQPVASENMQTHLKTSPQSKLGMLYL